MRECGHSTVDSGGTGQPRDARLDSFALSCDRLIGSDSGGRRLLGTRLNHTASGAREEGAGALTRAETGIV